MMGGENPVHMGEALLNPVADLLFPCHAAAQEDFLLGMAALGVGQSPQIAEHPLLGVLPDGAGVHHHHIGPLGLLHHGVAAHGQISSQFFGVGFVLLAAVGLHIGGGGAPGPLPEGGDLIAEGKLAVQLRLRNDGGFCIHGDSP